MLEGTGIMAQLLGALATFPVDPCLVSCTHVWLASFDL